MFRWMAIRRPNKKIWGLSQPVKLVICVATSAQMNRKELRAKATGLGQLHAFAILSHSLSVAYRRIDSKKVVFSEDRVGMDIGCNLVLLGGPENNRLTRKFLEQISSESIVNQKDNIIEWLLSRTILYRNQR